MKTKLTALLATVAILLSACGRTNSTMSWQEQYDLGVRYLEVGNYEESIIAFSAAIEIDPKRAETYLSLAEIYAEQGEWDAARAILQQGYEATEDPALSARMNELTEQEARQNRDAMAEELINLYSRVVSDHFLTCVEASFVAAPDESRGVISGHWADVNLDGAEEFVLTRRDENDQFIVEIYRVGEQELELLTSTSLGGADYCDQLDIELFYNTVQGRWCITTDMSYAGAYTGAWGYSVGLYQIVGDQIQRESSWEWNNIVMLGDENNIVQQAKAMGVNYLFNQDELLDERTEENDYRQLVGVESETLSGELPPEYTWASTITGNLTVKP